MANIKFTNADGTDEYRQALGAGTNLDPYRGTSLIQDGDDVDSTNPLHVQSADIDSRLGDTNETAASSDTATSGLNGRLQRVAQRITSLIALLPASLGQKARAASLAVTLSTEDVTALTPSTTATGAAAHDAAVSGNPVLLAATAQDTLPAAVSADADVVRLAADRSGRLYTRSTARQYTQTLTTTAATTYAAGASLGGLQTLTSVVERAGMATLLHSIQVNTRDNPSGLRLIVYHTNPATSTITNNVVIAQAYAEQNFVAFQVDLGSGAAIDANSFTFTVTTGLPKIIIPVGGTTLWYAVQATASYLVNGVSDISVTFGLMDI